MNNKFLSTLLSSTLSILPIGLIILILSFSTISPLTGNEYIFLAVGMIFLILGLSLFQIGAKRGISKVGDYIGGSLSKQKSLFIVIVFAFALGALITCAEPSIMIVTKQVGMNKILLVGSIAVGVGIFVVIGILRIIFHKSLKLWYLLFYFITFMFIIFIAMDEDKRKFLPFIFDSGGVTTGSATVPFILSLGAGIAAVRGGKNASNDSFGLVGLASIGPILTMTILVLLQGKGGTTQPYATISDVDNVFSSLLIAMLPGEGFGTLIEVAIALAPILVIFFIYNILFLKLPKSKIFGLLIGFLYAFIGLVLFLSATSSVMTPLGAKVGTSLGMFGKENGTWIIVIIAFIIGLVTILCEPAVHVLTNQMQDISEGRIRKSTVLFTLSIGVGIAIGLSCLRTIFNFSILYIVVPGYLLVIIMMFVCPNIYTAMAFDSGGTASGPMSSSFVLPLIAGLVGPLTGLTGEALQTQIFEQAFGVVALIALTPIIAIQFLGINENIKNIRAILLMRKYIPSEEDAEIIYF